MYTVFFFSICILRSLSNAIGTECPKVQAKSQEYISRFLEMYRSSGLTLSSPVANGSVSRDDNISGSDRSWSLFGWSFGRRSSKETRELDTENSKSLLEEFAFTIPRDPFLSPYLASDDTLAQLPPVKMLVPDRIFVTVR